MKPDKLIDTVIGTIVAILILIAISGCEQNPVNDNNDNPYVIPDSSYTCIKPMDCIWKVFGDSLIVKFTPIQPRHTTHIIIIVTYPDYENGVQFPITQETGIIVLRYFGIAPAPLTVKTYMQYTCRS